MKVNIIEWFGGVVVPPHPDYVTKARIEVTTYKGRRCRDEGIVASYRFVEDFGLQVGDEVRIFMEVRRKDAESDSD